MKPKAFRDIEEFDAASFARRIPGLLRRLAGSTWS